MCAENTHCAPVGTSLHKLCRKVCAECKKVKGRLSGGVTILNALRVALRIISGRIIFICSFETPAGVSKLLFHGRGRNKKRQLPRSFPTETVARRVNSLLTSREFPEQTAAPRKRPIIESFFIRWLIESKFFFEEIGRARR